MNLKEPPYQSITENISFRKLIENSYEGISLLDKDFNIIYRSRSAAQINGWTNQERGKLQITERLHADDIDNVNNKLQEVLQNPGKPISFVCRVKHRAGSYIWQECTYTNYLDDHDINAIVCNFRDITERKLAEEKLQENASFIKNISDNVPALISYWSADLICLYANKPHLDWFNKRQDEMQGITKQQLLGEDGFNLHLRQIQNVLKGEAQSFERSFHNSLGKTIYTHTQYLPDVDGDKVKGFYSMVYDISEIKQAEAVINKKNAEIDLFNNRLSLLSKASNEAIFELNLQRQEIWWSESHFKMFGFDPLLPVPVREEWLNKIHPESRPIISQILNDVASIGLNNWEYEINYFKPDHSIGILLHRGYVVRNAKQEAVRILGSYVDITKQKHFDQQKLILADISNIFNRSINLDESLQEVLKVLADFGGFSLAEAWLIDPEKKQINLSAKYPATAIMHDFYRDSAGIISFNSGQGMPGTVWKTKAVEVWLDVSSNEKFMRRKAAEIAGIKTLYGVPLLANDEVIGALLLGQNNSAPPDAKLTNLFTNLSLRFGPDIKRKQLEHELNQIFNLAPDIICILGTDGVLKKINPAMSAVLGYPEAELLSKPFLEFVHPDDLVNTQTQLAQIVGGSKNAYFENRYLTSMGKTKWLAWTTAAATTDNLTFCIAKDITEKKELEKLLIKAISLAKIGGWEANTRTGEVIWSAGAREIFEVPDDFMPTGENTLQFYKSTEDRNLMIQKIGEALKKGIAYDFEMQLVTAKGNHKWIRLIGEPEMGTAGSETIFGSFQDIDARKTAELNAVQILEERNIILESIDDAFFAVDKNWVVTYWNKSAERLFQRPKNTIINQSLVTVYPEWVGTVAYQKYKEVTRTGIAAHFEYKTLNFEKWFDISVYPTEYGLSVYVKDITARKNAELLAASVLDEKKLILESISDAFFAVDKNWTVTYWNKAAEKLYNIPKDSILNSNLLATFPTMVGTKVFDQYNKAMCGELIHFEYKAILIDRWLAASVSPTENGFTAYVTDINDRKIAEAQLNILNQNLQAQTKALAISNAELEQFAYVASHDLQEPLRMVTSFLTQIEKKYGTLLDDKGKQYINFAVDGAKRMRQIILDLLEFSRLHTFDDVLEEVNFNKVTGEVLALYRKTIEDTKASINVSQLPTLLMYRAPMRQVFQNLISNSLKYHKPGVEPQITVNCEERPADWLFCIKDNGIGIESGYFDKIFIIFQRLHNHSQFPGTGMGLAITKKIIENIGGELWVESEPGTGSAFYFTIPKK